MIPLALLLSVVLPLLRTNAPAAKRPSSLVRRVLIFLSIYLFSLVCLNNVLTGSLSTIYGERGYPQSDASSYYDAAIAIINGEKLSPHAASKPLYPVFLSFFMTFFGNDLLLLHVIQQLIFTCCATFLTEVVFLTMGFAVAIWTLIHLVMFYQANLAGVFMAENLGLNLGMLSTAFFVIGITSRSLPCYCLGILLLTLGLQARPGCMLVLPLLAFGSKGCLTPGGKRLGLHYIFYPLATAALALLLSSLLASTVVPEHTYTGWNAIQELYGLACGGKGYLQIFSDYPQLANTPPHLLSDQIMALTFERIYSSPQGIFVGIWSGFELFWLDGGIFWYLPGRSAVALSLILFILGVVASLQRPRSGLKTFINLSVLGIIFSSPFLLGGAYRARVLATTLPLLLLSFWCLSQYISDRCWTREKK